MQCGRINETSEPQMEKTKHKLLIGMLPLFPEVLRTSLGGAALDPRGDRRRSHLVTAGNAHVVRRQRLQPRHFGVKWRRCDVDQSGHRHLSLSLTHLFNLEDRRDIFSTLFS